MSEQIPQPPMPVSDQEARQWAMFSHMSVLLNLFTVFMGAAIPLIIYFLYKDRSKFVAFHAMQAFIMQVIYSFGGTLVAVLVGGIGGAIPVVGLVCIGLACILGILPLVALGYGVYGGIQVNQGNDFKYWLIGDWVQNNIVK